MRVKKWPQNVTEHSDALDLEQNVFQKDDPAAIARSLKASAERSRRRKADPYRSGMSMLTFYINCAGKRLAAKRKRVLEDAKPELRNYSDGQRSGNRNSGPATRMLIKYYQRDPGSGAVEIGYDVA